MSGTWDDAIQALRSGAAQAWDEGPAGYTAWAAFQLSIAHLQSAHAELPTIAEALTRVRELMGDEWLRTASGVDIEFTLSFHYPEALSGRTPNGKKRFAYRVLILAQIQGLAS